MGTENYLAIAVILLGSALFLFVGLFLVAQDASTRRFKLWSDELERNTQLIEANVVLQSEVEFLKEQVRVLEEAWQARGRQLAAIKRTFNTVARGDR